MANDLRSKKSEGQAFSLLLSLNTKKISQEKKIKLGVSVAVVANRVMDINSDGKPETIAAAHVSPNCNSVGDATVLTVYSKTQDRVHTKIYMANFQLYTIGDPKLGGYEEQIQRQLDDLISFDLFSAKNLPEWPDTDFTPVIRQKSNSRPAYKFVTIADPQTYRLARQKELLVWCYNYSVLNCFIYPSGRANIVELFKALSTKYPPGNSTQPFNGTEEAIRLLTGRPVDSFPELETD